MATWEESLAALKEYQTTLSTNTQKYITDLAAAAVALKKPAIPEKTITDPDDMSEYSTLYTWITWPQVPELDSIKPTTAELTKYKKHVWENSGLDTLEAVLLTWVNTGGTGIGADVQNAIFYQDYERRNQILKDSLSAAAATIGGRGFRIPNAMVDVKQSELLQKFQFDNTESSRNIVKTIADLAQKNIQYAVSQYSDIEKFHADYAIKYAALYLDTINRVLERYRIDLQSAIAQADHTTREVAARLEAYRAKVDVEYKGRVILMEAEKIRLDTALNIVREQSNAYSVETNAKVQALSHAASTTAQMLGAAGIGANSIYKG